VGDCDLQMRTSRPISLFTERPPARNRPSAFVVSMIVHFGVVGMVAFGFLYAPRINMDAAADRYILRQVDIDESQFYPKPASGSGSLDSDANSAQHAANAHGQLEAPASSVRKVARLKLADKTVVEPDMPIKMEIKQSPVPALLLWSTPQPKVRMMTPPHFRPPVLNNVRASLAPPNAAQHLADVAITPTPFSSPLPMPLPSSTTPITVQGPKPVELVPETTSASMNEPSSVAVLSISNLNMTKGAFALPPANQTAQGTEDGGMAPGHSGSAMRAGNGDPSSRGTSVVPGDGLGNPDGANDPKASGGKNGAGHEAGKGSGPGKGAGHGASTGTSSGPGIGAGDGPSLTLTPIKLPLNGQYGVVVVGSAMQEQYPETAGIWGGRLLYSVFLHVGLAKSWVLQYTLPASVNASNAGHIKQMQAPWPYYMMRPNVDPDYVNANAMMVHGYINEKGRFEHLELMIPPHYGQTQQLISALEQWQFRPAKQNGLPTRVEVLLIMPEGH